MQTRVDDLWTGFVETLEPELRALAARLPHALGLAPAPTLRWSEVFSHAITLGAPSLLAEAMPRATAAERDSAALAHLLGVVEAFGTDRLEDGQLRDAPEVRLVLDSVRRSRDAALLRLGSADGYRLSDATSLAAIREERRLLVACEPASLRSYRTLSLRKQAPGFPASLALGSACGWGAERLRSVALLLVGASLGLQAFDDAIDWEGDFARGGAWAVCLARRAGRERSRFRPETLAEARRLVLETGTLDALLRQSSRWFRLASRHAAKLGASELAAWASAREQAMLAKASRERTSPGYVVRAQLLAPWAAEILR